MNADDVPVDEVLVHLKSDTRFVLTVRNDGLVELWCREAIPVDEFADMLRTIAEEFVDGTAKRVDT
jgi:alanine racemase